MLSVEYIPMQYYDAIVIHFTDDDGYGHNIIVDGGEIFSPKICYTDKLKVHLEKIFNKRESIDLWIITHIDNDHIGGLYHFINDGVFFEKNHAQLKEVWMNYGGDGDFVVQRKGVIGYNSGKKLRNVLHEKKINLKEGVIAGISRDVANVGISVIAPDVDSYNRYIKWWNSKEFNDNVKTSDGLVRGGNWDYDIKFTNFDLKRYDEDNEVKNNSSIAFVLFYNQYKVLFSADSCSSILLNGLEKTKLLKNGKVSLDLVHVPHHGSSRNSCFSFLKSLVCNQYVITGNGENKYKLPDKETIARLIGANPTGCELHFTAKNQKLQEIFTDEDDVNLSVCYGAKFLFE